MRDLTTVIKQVLTVIPEDHELQNILPTYCTDEYFDEYETWNLVGDVLYNHIFFDFYPEVSWQSEVERIWTGDDEPDSLDYTNF